MNIIEPLELDKQKKIVFTKDDNAKIFPIKDNFNFLYIHNIQVNAHIASPSDLILHWRRMERTGEIKSTQSISLSLREVAFALKDNWHIFQTSDDKFFKDGNNFAVKGRRIELWIEHINGEEFEVQMYVEPRSSYMNL